jgi:hypothetical protein
LEKETAGEAAADGLNAGIYFLQLKTWRQHHHA